MKLMRGSKRRAIEKLEDAGHHQTLPFGSCSPGKCKGETACRSFPNNTYTCVCTHSSLPPTASGKCARNVVNVGAVIPILQKIPVQPPPEDQEATPTILKSISVTDIPIPIQGKEASFHFESFLIFGIISTIIIFLFGMLIYYFRRKTKRRSNTASPINLKQSLLIPERYAPNPHYSACCSTDVPVIRKETLEFLDELGEGCFGKVFKGELTRSPEVKPDIVAIKVLKETASKEAEEDFFREVEIMSTFRHPNILSFIGVVLREGTSCGLINPMMVFEYMEHGDLAEVLRSQNSCSASSSNQNYGLEHIVVQSIDLLNAAFQIASGMEYLAAQRFVHRDLACRNCLVAEGPTVKIADFGMSRDVYTCDYYKTGGSRLLPVRWMSPESVVYGRFTLESDIWSYGVVLWEIFSYGKQPYYGHTNEEVVKLILDGIMLIPPEDSPPFICELMKNCWKTEPKHRTTFSTIKVILEEAFYNKTVEMKEQLTSIRSPSVASSRNEIFFSQTPNINKRSFPNRITDQKLKSLPRPPPLPRTISDTDLLDSDGYLQANVVKEPALYLQTLPSD